MRDLHDLQQQRLSQQHSQRPEEHWHEAQLAPKVPNLLPGGPASPPAGAKGAPAEGLRDSMGPKEESEGQLQQQQGVVPQDTPNMVTRTISPIPEAFQVFKISPPEGSQLQLRPSGLQGVSTGTPGCPPLRSMRGGSYPRLGTSSPSLSQVSYTSFSIKEWESPLVSHRVVDMTGPVLSGPPF